MLLICVPTAYVLGSCCFRGRPLLPLDADMSPPPVAVLILVYRKAGSIGTHLD